MFRKRCLENCTICAGCPEENCQRRIPDRLTDCLGKLATHSQLLVGLIDNMLEKGSIMRNKHMDKIPIDSVTVDLREILQQMKDLFSLQMQEKNLFFEVYPVKLQHPMVFCDRIQLERLLINLLSNAYEYSTSNGGVMVTLAEISSMPEGERALYGDYEFHIHDNGINIPPIVVKSLTEDYNPDYTDVSGLYITRNIVQSMGGSIEVYSSPERPGKDIVIKFTLPIVAKEMCL